MDTNEQSNIRDDGSTSISTALMKQLLLAGNSDQKITNEALEAASFLLREFILEARNRASIEAEFDTEGDDEEVEKSASDMDSTSGMDKMRRRRASSTKMIQPKHILRIACELMMDFS
mmetsp:Transcript_12210/g.22893  ORF Transcript_12210/g.22893 Transcript_12210/m.22893 type:complete len:118 (-) Transcript_12210:161-514(-)